MMPCILVGRQQYFGPTYCHSPYCIQLPLDYREVRGRKLTEVLVLPYSVICQKTGTFICKAVGTSDFALKVQRLCRDSVTYHGL